jgi:fermentation-respiration switch protein FrsA (DUF1100 family)
VLAGSNCSHLLPARTLVHGLVQSLTTHYGPYAIPTGKGSRYTDVMIEANAIYAWSSIPVVDLYLTLVVALAGAILAWSLTALARRAITLVGAPRDRHS